MNLAALSLRLAFAASLILAATGCTTTDTGESDEDLTEEITDQDGAALGRDTDDDDELCEICDSLRETTIQIGVPNGPRPPKATPVQTPAADKKGSFDAE